MPKTFFIRNKKSIRFYWYKKNEKGICLERNIGAGYSFSWWPRLELDLNGGGHSVLLSIAFPVLGSLYISFSALEATRYLQRFFGYYERNYGFYTCSSHISAFFNICQEDTSRGWDANFFLSWERLLKGKDSYDEPRVIETKTIQKQTLPFSGYESQIVTLTISRIKYRITYSRWFSREFYKYELVPDILSYHAGKGENSWDCEPSATSSLSIPAENWSFEQAADLFINHVNESRQRYG